jgi:hypothetical protein
MKLPKPQYIANTLIHYGNNPGFKNLQDVIFTFFKEKGFSLSDEEIWDYIEQNIKDIAKELFIKIDNWKNDGIE